MKKNFVNDGTRFIGSAVVRHLVTIHLHVISVDKLSYAGPPDSLEAVSDNPYYCY